MTVRLCSVRHGRSDIKGTPATSSLRFVNEGICVMAYSCDRIFRGSFLFYFSTPGFSSGI